MAKIVYFSKSRVALHSYGIDINFFLVRSHQLLLNAGMLNFFLVQYTSIADGNQELFNLVQWKIQLK